MKVVCVCGPHNSGKTTLVRGLIEELSRRGYRVGVAKSTKHSGLFLEPGKDSSLFVSAGSKEVGVFEPDRVSLFWERSLPPELIPFLFSCDVFLLEGFHKSSFPKIAVLGKDDSEYWRDVENVVAAVVPGPCPVPWQVPVFSAKDIGDIADFVEGNIPTFDGVMLEVNGKVVEMKPFVQRLLRDVIVGVVKNLKGTEGARRIRVEIVL